MSGIPNRSGRPTSPLGIVWRSPIWSYCGYADEGRTFAKALAGGARPLRLESIPWESSDNVRLPANEDRLFRALSRVERPRDAIVIIDSIPIGAEPDPLAAVNVLRTTFETDRIPAEWLPHLDRFDEIWVISRHNYEAFCRSGVPPEKLRRVPSCVDTELYRPDGPRHRRPEELADRFLFLSVFDWQLRKGWDVLLSAYCQAFRPEDGVGLLLKVSHVHGYRWNDVIDQAEGVLQSVGQSLGMRPDLVLSNEPLEVADMANLYRSADAFVLASRGEGWGRPLMEAMASGLAVIGTRGSGNVDFMRPENSYLVDVRATEVPEAAAQEIPIYRGHWWCEPDEQQLREVLRRAVANPVERQAIAMRARADVVEGFSLDVGGAFVERIICVVEQRRSAGLGGQARCGVEDMSGPSEPSPPLAATRPPTDRSSTIAAELPPPGSEAWLPEPWLRRHVPRSGRTFLDIGANYGAWTRWLAPRFEEIHAVEPNPAALVQLLRQLPANVTVHEVGAWNRSGQVRFSQFAQSVHLSAYFETQGINTGPQRGVIDLPCMPVDDLPISGPVDFIKCDTEGAEVECLRGAEQLIARDRPRLVIEIHSLENFRRVTRLLSDWRYSSLVVRDPNYAAFSRNWFSHCWLVAESQE